MDKRKYNLKLHFLVAVLYPQQNTVQKQVLVFLIKPNTPALIIELVENLCYLEF